MSSAALQPAPHQSTTVTSLSPTASSSNRTYSSQPSQAKDPYYSQQSSGVSPASTAARKTSRRLIGNGALPSSQQPTQHHSSTSYVGSSAPKSSRPSNKSVQLSQTAIIDTPVDYQRGVPPVAPPRTSSNQKSSGVSLTASALDRSRRNETAAESRQPSSRATTTGDGLQDRVDARRSNGGRQVNGNEKETSQDDTEATANAASRSRRRAQQSPQSILPERSNSNGEGRAALTTEVTQSRPQIKSATASFIPNGLSREGSEIFNRVIVSQPEVDIERERERERMGEAQPPPATSELKANFGLNVEGVDDAGGSSRSRHENTATSLKREKNTRFGEYFLGNTLGEGEFGKVKMGWKQEGGVQVAIKLIRRDSVGTNATRRAKIYREIAILREISHPNIVRLHEMVETEKHIGIILEYASGGELFDYILNHRYLKDNPARKLFAQLISGVGYLHKKGIVHRDLKLENLLLDRNRNIIITDFGFANTFNPNDDLGEEIEYGLLSRDFVKRMELDKILPNGFRRGDLMQTSCGSPCYAAPELVVSDSLYTGRKVDVWSCGVILYAMLAGYLPFDDDPANPEGDNINLLYKYIVSTPLTFPEYVTPHARDLLRRILVPDPRKRADLFEVARHSWLSEYADVVGFITSSTTTTGDIANTTVITDDHIETPMLARSASVREPTKTQKMLTSTVGDLGRKHGTVDQEVDDYAKPSKDNKRRTVQLEYVAPRSQTVRGEDALAAAPSSSRTHARPSSQGPVRVSSIGSKKALSTEKPLPQDPPISAQVTGSSRKSTNPQAQHGMAPPTRPGRELPRSVSENAYFVPPAGASIGRPNTGGSMTSTASGFGLPSRGSYGQPVAPTVAGTNVHGHMSQPKNNKKYAISNPLLQDEQDMEYGRPSISQVPLKFSKTTGFPGGGESLEGKGHKRSNTVSGIGEKLFGRNVSFLGGKSHATQEKMQEKQKKSYPPVSMSTVVGAGESRQSIDSTRRSISFGFGRKRSGSITGSGGASSQEKPRRFSLLPASFSLKAIGIGKDSGATSAYIDDPYYNGPEELTGREGRSRSGTAEEAENPAVGNHVTSATPPKSQRYTSQAQLYGGTSSGTAQHGARDARNQEFTMLNESDASITYQNSQAYPNSNRYPRGFNDYEPEDVRATGSRAGRVVLQKNHRKFADHYEQEPSHQNAGSSGAARKVMDFFRRRGRARENDDR